MRIRTREAAKGSTQAMEMSGSPRGYLFPNPVLMGLTHHSDVTEAIHTSMT